MVTRPEPRCEGAPGGDGPYPRGVPRDVAPQAIVDLAERRATARRAGDWATADGHRAAIEAAGWRIIDIGTLYDLERAAPADASVNGVPHYGSSASVPSRLGEAPVGTASVVIVATDWAEDLARTVRWLVARSPDGTQLVVVANAPSEDQATALADLDATDPGAPGVVTEVVWTAGRLAHAAAVNAGIRRAVAPVVVLLDTSVEAQGDLVSALVAALADATVAVAGPFGLVTEDLGRFDPAPDDATDVAAISGLALAFRRSDFVTRGPLDERFVLPDSVDAWWSLTLRDPPGDRDEGAAPRRAVQVGGVPTARHLRRPAAWMSAADRERQAKRNRYRVLKAFATRRDLLVTTAGTR